MIWHPRLRVRRSQPRDQFRFIGMTGNDGSSSRLALAQGVLAEDERHPIFLSNATMTLHTVLIQDRLNIVGEANRIARPAVSEPCSRDDANNDDCNKHHDDARSTGWG